jgi:predicted MFS family arabinose efflux permease
MQMTGSAVQGTGSGEGGAADGGPAPGDAARGWTLAALATLPTLAIAALVSILPVLFTRFGAEPGAQWLVPMILTVPSLCVALFSPWLGAAADRWGRRRVLLPALVAFAACGLGPFLADSLHAILATRFVVGLAEAAILAVSNALMGDYFGEEQRRRWLGLQSMVGPFVSVGYVLAGGFLGSWQWRGPFLLYLMGLVVLVPCMLFLPEPKRRSTAQEGTQGFPWRLAARTGSLTLLVSIVFFVQNVQHGRIFSDLGAGSPALISELITIAGLATALGGLAYRQLRGRGESTQLAIVFAAYAIGYVGLWLSPGYIVGVPFDAVGQFAGGFAIPVLIAWTLRQYAPRYRGAAMGLWASCFFLGQFLSPPLLTLVGHGQWSFLATVGVAGIACAGFAIVSLLVGARPAVARAG